MNLNDNNILSFFFFFVKLSGRKLQYYIWDLGLYAKYRSETC